MKQSNKQRKAKTMTITIREAYNQALGACKKRNAPESQQHMVACLAVKDAMENTLENSKALLAIMKENNPFNIG
jgi:N-acetylglutamate synthase-like GNAT family acetyltransferase